MNTTTIHIHGEIHGDIWMPSTHCWKPIRKSIKLPANERYCGDVRDAINSALSDGDFQSAKFTPDTSITITREWTLPAGTISSGSAFRHEGLKPFKFTQERAIDVSKLGPLYVEECDGHDFDFDGDGDYDTDAAQSAQGGQS